MSTDNQPLHEPPYVKQVLPDIEGGETNLLPASAAQADLEVWFPMFPIPNPGTSEEKLTLYWDGSPAAERTWNAPVAPDTLFVVVAQNLLRQGENEIYYHFVSYNGTGINSAPYTITIDTMAPVLNTSERLIFPAEIVTNGVTAQYLQDHGDKVEAVIPNYAPIKPGDVLTWYWDRAPGSREEAGSYTLTRLDMGKPLTATFDGAMIVRRGDGDRYAYYQIRDRAGNPSHHASPVILDVSVAPISRDYEWPDIDRAAGSGEHVTLVSEVADSGATVIVPEFPLNPGEVIWVQWAELGQFGAYRTATPTPAGSRETKRTMTLTGQPVRTLSQVWYDDDHLHSREQHIGGQSSYKETFIYDQRGRLEEYTCTGDDLPKDAYGNRIKSQAFRFDALDNITRCISEFADDPDVDVARFTYADDDTCQLTKMTHSHASYPQETEFSYDADGHLLNDQAGRKLSYNSQGRLIEVKSATDQPIIAYHYDGHDDLVAVKKATGSETQRFYQGYNLSHTVQDNTLIQCLFDQDRPIGQQQYGDDSKTLLLLTNAANSVMGESSSGDEPHTRGYSAYGDQPDDDLQCLLAFNGELREDVGGWYLLGRGYRAYNPGLMRFHSPDSLSPFGGGGINPYMYCAGNPISFRDPTGHRYGKPDPGYVDPPEQPEQPGGFMKWLGVIGGGVGIAVSLFFIPWTGGSSLAIGIGLLGIGVMAVGMGYEVAGVITNDEEKSGIGRILLGVGGAIALIGPAVVTQLRNIAALGAGQLPSSAFRGSVGVGSRLGGGGAGSARGSVTSVGGGGRSGANSVPGGDGGGAGTVVRETAQNVRRSSSPAPSPLTQAVQDRLANLRHVNLRRDSTSSNWSDGSGIAGPNFNANTQAPLPPATGIYDTQYGRMHLVQYTKWQAAGGV